MKKLLTLFFIGLLTWVSCEEGFAQKRKKKDRTELFGFHFKNAHRKTEVIPFKVYSNLIVMKVVVDQSDTLNFILDTGVSSTFIVDPQVGEKLGFEYIRQVQITGAGEEQTLTADITIKHSVQFGSVIGYQQNLVVLSRDILKLSEFMGIPIHGIFGHELFSNFVVNIDFSRLEIKLTKPSKFKFRKKHGERYPIVVTQTKPYTDAFFITAKKNESEIPVRLVIDTGAGHALLLNDNEAKIPLPDKVIRANLGRGLNGEISGHLGRVSTLRMGSIELNDVIASFPDSISFSMKFPPSDNDRQGSIGCEFLRRFKIVMNYHEGYMALKPIKNRIKEAFEHDMSGLDIRATGPNLQEFVVSEVQDDSPAFYSGMQKGDQIVFLNNINMKDLSISDIIRLLATKEGKRIEIFYRRSGSLSFASFELKRII